MSHSFRLFPIPVLATLLVAAATSLAMEPKLLFSDTFDRNESQEEKDELGNGWGTNSRTRAKGNKQTDLGDGTMRVFIHETADHAVSVTHPLGFTDGIVKMRFKLEDKKDKLGINFADLSYKKVHAGHLCMAVISNNNLQIKDLKDGPMRIDLRKKRAAGQKMSEDEKQLIREKIYTTESESELAGDWRELEVTIKADTMTVSIDGDVAAAFTSSGIAHPTKATLRLSIPRNAVIDDIELWKLK